MPPLAGSSRPSRTGTSFFSTDQPPVIKRTGFLLGILCLLAWTFAMAGDDMEPLVGDWTSPDGTLKHSVARTFDGELLETKMWFKFESAWKLVSQGNGYRRPGEKAWRFVSRVTDMEGIELFESTIEQTSDSTYRVVNISYSGDGSTVKTEEEWSFIDGDRYAYKIFRTEDGQRSVWYEGEWVRADN